MPVQEASTAARDDVGFEFMLGALRLADGVPAALFAERTGTPLAIVAGEIAAATARGLPRSPAIRNVSRSGTWTWLPWPGIIWR